VTNFEEPSALVQQVSLLPYPANQLQFEKNYIRKFYLFNQFVVEFRYEAKCNNILMADMVVFILSLFWAP
jgi:hypothetical protein